MVLAGRMARPGFAGSAHGKVREHLVCRPSLSASQMATVLTLQALHDYSEREAIQAVRFDVRWEKAIGAPLDGPGFDASLVVCWRRPGKLARPHRSATQSGRYPGRPES